MKKLVILIYFFLGLLANDLLLTNLSLRSREFLSTNDYEYFIELTDKEKIQFLKDNEYS